MLKKILIITHSIAPGKDGVGDYCRMFAKELRRLGHECKCLGLYDTEDVDTLDERRFSAQNVTVDERFIRLQQIVKQYDVVSLQLSPFGWNNCGILRELATNLKKYRIPLQHINVHETWIGWGKDDTIKHRVLGYIQKYYMRRILSLTSNITTTNNLYLTFLSDAGYPATLLPLFGFPEVSPIHTLPIVKDAKSTWFLVFGALHPAWFDEQRLAHIFAQTTNPVLVQVGLARHPEVLAKLQLLKVKLLQLGEQEPGVISTLMQMSDYGISTNPPDLLGKSGTTQGMLEHGLPVIVTRDPLFGGVIDLPPNCYTIDTFKQASKHGTHTARQTTVAGWIHQFL